MLIFPAIIKHIHTLNPDIFQPENKIKTHQERPTTEEQIKTALKSLHDKLTPSMKNELLSPAFRLEILDRVINDAKLNETILNAISENLLKQEDSPAKFSKNQECGLNINLFPENDQNQSIKSKWHGALGVNIEKSALSIIKREPYYYSPTSKKLQIHLIIDLKGTKNDKPFQKKLEVPIKGLDFNLIPGSYVSVQFNQKTFKEDKFPTIKAFIENFQNNKEN